MPVYASRQSQCLFPGPRTTFWWEMGQKVCGCALKLPLLSCFALLSILALASNLTCLPCPPHQSPPGKINLMAPCSPTSLLCPSSSRNVQFSAPQALSCEGLCPLWTGYPQASAWLPHLLIGLSEDRHGYRSQVPKEHSSFLGLRDDQDGWGALVHRLEVRGWVCRPWAGFGHHPKSIMGNH